MYPTVGSRSYFPVTSWLVLVAVRKQRISNGQNAISVGHRTVGFPSIHSANANRKLFLGRQILPTSTGMDQSEGIQRSDLVSSPASISVRRISPIQRSDMWCPVVCVSLLLFVFCVWVAWADAEFWFCCEHRSFADSSSSLLLVFKTMMPVSCSISLFFSIILVVFFCFVFWLLTRVRKHLWTCLAWSSDLLWWWRTHCKSLIVSV